MIAVTGLGKNTPPLLLIVMLLVSGCGIASSYRPADSKTLRDLSGSSDYRKTVGVMVLTNTTQFTSEQAATPFLAAFLSSLRSVASDAVLVVPDQTDVPPFLGNPPRLANGDLDVFTLSGLARQEGLNAIVSPVLMDIRVRTRDTGFWFFKDVAYRLQVQTAATIYDAITGSRLALEMLTDVIDIDEDQAAVIGKGQEVLVDDLVDVAGEMGKKLGRGMGDVIQDSQWLASVVSVENGMCVLAAGSESGIEAGDRFSVLDGSRILTGVDGQRYVVPGLIIGEITIRRVASRQSYAAPESGNMPPAGSILVPAR
jgi:hypothetical protein